MTVPSGTDPVQAAYERCEEITREQARNFSYGIRLLPPPKRRALSAVYALARRIDDIGDGTGSAEERLAGLGAVRADLKLLRDQDTGDAAVARDPVLLAVADAARRYPVPVAAFDELVDGCEADVRGSTYDDLADLVGYCRRVAGSVGRLSLGVFVPPEGAVGAPLPIDRMLDLSPEPATADDLTSAELADVLGIALQLTNILRDVLEDRRAGRIYLPKRDLARFGVRLGLSDVDSTGGVGFTDDHAALAGLIRYEAARAGRWYRLGLRLLPRLDRRSAACTGAMAGIYHTLLRRIWRDPMAVTRGRVALPARQKALVAARALVGRR
ncbi:squalene/phytoene synthase family protein [Actinocatenispora rupis]|uniref:Squalene synthase HpnD n=1 Tax=Actinocatenispora rupis TaxID=519421 RepID=A0A8J3J557_9ACTN|nr:squalene/phytoene synthase family protein [Actinocatenispora rupis]GID11806.1 squalene synthase HpnD [Actinocatenispora rupis]